MHLRTSFYDCCPESQYYLQHFVCIQSFCRSHPVRKNKPDIPIRSSVSARKQNGRRCFIPTSAQKRHFHMFHCFVTLKIKKILQSVSRRLRLPARSWPLPSHRVQWPWTFLSHGCRRRWQVLPSWNPKHGKYG